MNPFEDCLRDAQRDIASLVAGTAFSDHMLGIRAAGRAIFLHSRSRQLENPLKSGVICSCKLLSEVGNRVSDEGAGVLIPHFGNRVSKTWANALSIHPSAPFRFWCH